MITLTTVDIIGGMGVLIVVIAYFLLQVGKLKTENIYFSVLNLLGSLLIMYSLLYNWNFASFLIEFFWILISIIGIYNSIKKR